MHEANEDDDDVSQDGIAHHARQQNHQRRPRTTTGTDRIDVYRIVGFVFFFLF